MSANWRACPRARARGRLGCVRVLRSPGGAMTRHEPACFVRHRRESAEDQTQT